MPLAPEVPSERKQKQTSASLVSRLSWSVLLVFLGGFGAALVQTDFGKIQVNGLRLQTETNQWVTADLFKPASATAASPVPLVIVCPGFERSKETVSHLSIELARRGMAVIAIDPYNQGGSSSTAQKRSATKEGYGVVPMAQHVMASSDFSFVDKRRIGAAGYSAGGNAVLQSASLFGARMDKALRQAKRADSAGGREITPPELASAKAQNILSAVFVGGYVLTMTDEVLASVHANVGMDYARWDEGAYRTQLGSARMEAAAEALRLVNSALPPAQKVSGLELSRRYGAVADQSLRVVYNTKNIHPTLPYDPRFVAHLLDFFTTVFQMPAPVSSLNQTWFLKELCSLVSLIGGFLFVLPCAAVLLRIESFRKFLRPVPPPLPPPGGRGRLLFWTLFGCSAALACGLFMPLARATAYCFPRATTAQQTWWFPQRINNAILLWAVANGVIGLAMFCLNYRFYSRNHGVSKFMWGIDINTRDLLKTLLVAISVAAGFYLLLFANYALFHSDLRFIFVAASTAFPSKMLLVALEYLPAFFIFYAANSIRVNAGLRFAGQPEWLNLLINALANSVGLMLILVIQYVHLAFAGRVFWTDGWLYVNLLLGVIPLMFLLPYYHRAFFRLTGRVWLGPMVTCLIFIMMMLTNNVCYIPLK